MSESDAVLAEVNCRLELYRDADQQEEWCDLDSPHFPLSQTSEVFDWIVVTLVDLLKPLPKNERRAVSGTIHLRMFTNGPAAWLTIPPRFCRGAARLGLPIRVAHYATCPPNEDDGSAPT